jgi:hypothetical protein
MGTLFAMLLYGIICLQSHLYFQHYPKDPWFMKSVVGVIWLLETIQIVLSIYYMDVYLIVNFDFPQALTFCEWSLSVAAIFGFVIGWMVNLFFVSRIWLLSKNLWVTCFIGALATIRAAFGITVCYYTFPYPSWLDFRTHAYPYILAGLSLGVVVDCLITLAVSRQLIKGRTGISDTDVLLKRLLGYTLNTGFITSLFAIIEIITFVTSPHTLVFLSFVFVQNKLYANCLLATLNARNDLRARLPAVKVGAGSEDGNMRMSRWSPIPKSSPTQTRAIQISTETVVQKDPSYPSATKSPTSCALSFHSPASSVVEVPYDNGHHAFPTTAV